MSDSAFAKEAAIAELEAQVARDTKQLLNTINSWFYLMSWCSAFDEKVYAGSNSVDLVLSSHQSSEFAFSHDQDNHPETIVIFTQPDMFECLVNIGIHGFRIDDDGVVIFIKECRIFDFYIAPFNLKIKASLGLSQRLKVAAKHCKYAQLGKITSSYNNTINTLHWSVDQVTKTVYPIGQNKLAFD